MLLEQLDKIVLSLKLTHPKHYRIICYRFGLHNRKPRSLSEIAAIVNLTKERVRQIQNWSLKRIYKELGNTDFKQFLDNNEVVTKQEVLTFLNVADNNLVDLLLATFDFITFPMHIHHIGMKLIQAWTSKNYNKKVLQQVALHLYTAKEFKICDVPFEEKYVVHALKLFQVSSENDMHFLTHRRQKLQSSEQVFSILQNNHNSMTFSEIHDHFKGTILAKSLLNVLSSDKRFRPLGKTSKWGLSEWTHENTKTIKELIVEYMQDQPKSVNDVFKYVSSIRPVSKRSILFYMKMGFDGLKFKKVDVRTYQLV